MHTEPVRSQAELVRRLRELGPFADDASAELALSATLEALADFLSSDERDALRCTLPEELQHAVSKGPALLKRDPGDAAAEAPVVANDPSPTLPHDLAEGRPGGRHPLASSNPALAAHRHSVARSADPHAESKLSSPPGLGGQAVAPRLENAGETR